MNLNGLKNWSEEDLKRFVEDNLDTGRTEGFAELCAECLDYIIGSYEDEYLHTAKHQDVDEFEDEFDYLWDDYHDSKFVLWNGNEGVVADKYEEKIYVNYLGRELLDEEASLDASIQDWKDEMRELAKECYSEFIEDDKRENWGGLERSRVYIQLRDGGKKFYGHSLKDTLIRANEIYETEGTSGDVFYEFNSLDEVKICSGDMAKKFNPELIDKDLTLDDIGNDRNFLNVYKYFLKENWGWEDEGEEDTLDAYKISHLITANGIELENQETLVQYFSNKYLSYLEEEKRKELEDEGMEM